MKDKGVCVSSVGAVSLLTVFCVLCLVIFAVLSVSTAQSQRALSRACAESVEEYYEAQSRAEELLARLRSGEIPPEVEREGITYTYETVEELKQREPENQLTFLVGADSLDYMERWKYPERIFSACRIAAVIRPGFSYEQMEEKIRQLKAQFDADILLVPTPEIPISSTDLRKKLNGGESVKEWIPKPVEAYIKKHGLYQQKP